MTLTLDDGSKHSPAAAVWDRRLVEGEIVANSGNLKRRGILFERNEDGLLGICAAPRTRVI